MKQTTARKKIKIVLDNLRLFLQSFSGRSPIPLSKLLGGATCPAPQAHAAFLYVTSLLSFTTSTSWFIFPTGAKSAEGQVYDLSLQPPGPSTPLIHACCKLWALLCARHCAGTRLKPTLRKPCLLREPHLLAGPWRAGTGNNPAF